MRWSLCNFAQTLSAVLSWHVQNFVAIRYPAIKQFSIKFKLCWKNVILNKMAKILFFFSKIFFYPNFFFWMFSLHHKSSLVQIMAWRSHAMIWTSNDPVHWHIHVTRSQCQCVSTLLLEGMTTLESLIARFMGPTWGPSGADRTQVGPCWPHELCYLGYLFNRIRNSFGNDLLFIKPCLQ